jgi:hypothetical protein
LQGYTHHTSKFGTFAPSPAGEGWGEEIQKAEFKCKWYKLNPPNSARITHHPATIPARKGVLYITM